MSLDALIWDFDGTLVDTRHRNLAVTREIVERVSGRPASEYPELASVDRYERLDRRVANWRELYREAFDFTVEQTDRAGLLWTEHQLRSDVPTPLFPGVADAVARAPDVPQGIVSLNARENIEAVLERRGLRRHFRAVVGYAEVDLQRQKPAPDGLFRCLDAIAPDAAGTVLYVGDHPTDVRCAEAANRSLRVQGRNLRVVTVAARFRPSTDVSRWSPPPDHVVREPAEVAELAHATARGTPSGA